MLGFKNEKLLMALSSIMNIFSNEQDYLIGSKPNMGKETPFQINDLTTDPVRYKRTIKLVRKCPNIRLWGVTNVFAKAVNKRFKAIRKKKWAEQIDLKILIINNQKDRVVDEKKIDDLTKSLKNKFRNFRVWCAASTHNDEEIIIGKLHKKLKKTEKKLITIIIPRHISRANEIIEALNNLDLNCITHSSNQKPQKETDIYLVDSYGESSRFYNLTNISFVGGSIINHGGQNPLEPARLGNYIVNGPNVKNFKEIYTFLNNLKMSSSTSNILSMEDIILKRLKTKTNNKNIKKIIKIGNDILEKNLFHINKYLI